MLGGNWFSTNKLGESAGYLMSDFKSKIFEPLVNRVAQKIFENEQRQSANFWVLIGIVLWNSLITLSLIFKWAGWVKCGRNSVMDMLEMDKNDHAWMKPC